MGNKFLEKILNDSDLKESALNLLIVGALGYTANVISNKLGFNLNHFNSINHAAIGTVLGSFFYRKAGGGLWGVMAGLGAATGFNGAWETIEYYCNIYGNVKPPAIDIITDIACVYGGSILGFLGEKAKKYINKRK